MALQKRPWCGNGHPIRVSRAGAAIRGYIESCTRRCPLVACTVADTTLRQCQDDFNPYRVAGVITYLSNARDGTRAVLDEPSLTYLNRSFCIFEVACTVGSKLYIDMSDDTAHMFLEGAFSVDASAATSTSKKHKCWLDGYIFGRWGSFITFNESVSASFKSAAVGRLVGLLAGGAPGAHEQAARALANLADQDAENQRAIGRAPGAVEGLVGLLASGAPGAQAARALASLAVKDAENKRAIGRAPGAVEGLVGLLAGGAPGAQEQAARALANLAVKDAENQRAIGRALGAVEGLVGLLAGGAPGAQEQAALALANLAVKDAENRRAIGRAPGAVEGLVGLLAGGAPGAQEQAALALANLAKDAENKRAIMAAGAGHHAWRSGVLQRELGSERCALQ
ncbi:unnamed protein product [Prorocentrum cordatum]|uniref:Vacuolar protein 8 n=1 Tax=Prorocentrum cordatum TaxID=2364126 RepID=A0ABN9YAK3_9DINO|nr:unnamed protein product [Polarella glacialis]